jgi:hypothetical protein
MNYDLGPQKKNIQNKKTQKTQNNPPTQKTTPPAQLQKKKHPTPTHKAIFK